MFLVFKICNPVVELLASFENFIENFHCQPNLLSFYSTRLTLLILRVVNFNPVAYELVDLCFVINPVQLNGLTEKGTGMLHSCLL